MICAVQRPSGEESQKLVSMTMNTAPSGVNVETPVILPKAAPKG